MSGSRPFEQGKGFLQTVVALGETGYSQMEETGFLRPALRFQLMGHFVDLSRMFPIVVEHVTQENDGTLGSGRIPVGVVMVPVLSEMLMGMDVLVRVDVRMSMGVGRSVCVGVRMRMFVGMFMAVAAGTLEIRLFVN